MTLGNDVFHRLRSDILAGKFTPGQQLRLAPLGIQYGVSLSVLREALTRLAGQDLVRSEPQMGFSIVTLSEREILDLTEVRVHIAGLAMEWAIERGDVRWEGDMIAAHHVMTTIPRFASLDPPAVSEEWAEAHANFHTALMAGCQSERLLAIQQRLYDAAEIYRRWAAPAEPNRAEGDEHQAILAAALARDAHAARELLAQHVRRTAEILLQGRNRATPSTPRTPVKSRRGRKPRSAADDQAGSGGR
jgi:DNA-binding GntR family transcriptional regulator